MTSFRLTTAKNTMLIYVNSFRFCQPYLPIESQFFYLSRIGFVTVQNLKDNLKNPNITIMFPFYNLFMYDKFVQYILQTQVQDMAYPHCLIS